MSALKYQWIKQYIGTLEKWDGRRHGRIRIDRGFIPCDLDSFISASDVSWMRVGVTISFEIEHKSNGFLKAVRASIWENPIKYCGAKEVQMKHVTNTYRNGIVTMWRGAYGYVQAFRPNSELLLSVDAFCDQEKPCVCVGSKIRFRIGTDASGGKHAVFAYLNS